MEYLAILVPIVAIVVGPGVWVANNWVRARHGFEPVGFGDHDRDPGPDDRRQLASLRSDNERLAGQVSRLEERIAVLERIATDPAERIGREIERLR